ncbi:MAG: alpha/beta fold hydrolase [Bacteroidota bacterium]
MKFHIKKWKWIALLLILLGNIISYNHAYRFTHFTDTKLKTKKAEHLSLREKASIVFFGISNPRPINKRKPEGKYETITIESHKKLEGWLIKKEKHRGIIILFHGYAGSKSGNLDYSREFNRMGYSSLLIDFMGSGGSEGNQTTLGHKESRDVKESYEYIKKRFPGEEIILFGSSMGAVSIMKSIKKYNIQPTKIIVECPFGKMKTTVKKRFEAMSIPSFGFTELLLFYGSVQNGFNAFKHNPIDYSKYINIPTMLLYGLKDDRVTIEEIESIYNNLQGEKELRILEDSGHENYLVKSHKNWAKFVKEFLER